MLSQKQKSALRQLNALKKLGKDLRLAADSWKEDWQTLIATLMSARTTDKKTIPVAQELFSKYHSINSLADADISDIASIIRPVNFYKTKAKHIKELAQIIVRDYNGKIPHDFSKLIELPGVGRKTANVFLAEYEGDNIGVDTHLAYCSHRLGWTKNTNPYKIEKDLEKLFPKKYWRELNWIVVKFGQTYTSRRKKNEILERVKRVNR